ncbi:MAG: sigma-70 family RNA polymerase sigma factor [Myxococcales bacterium]|nr:sigma-70 family RNA polymerase sigma factor [Myxococcales bacterium]
MSVTRETAASLDALMARLARGDRAAFDPLFRALLPRARAVLRRRLAGAEVDDVAQSALLKLFANASEFEPGRALLPWFYALVGNELRAVTRRAAHRAVTVDPDAAELSRGGDDPEQALIEQELRMALRDAVASLDDTSRAAIAALLGEAPPRVDGETSESALRKRLSRAYARLRLRLKGVHDVDP